MSVKCFAVPYDKELSTAARYSEDGRGGMRGGEIVFSAEAGDATSADWLYVGDSPWACFHTNIPRERRILFLMEPPGVRRYSAHYLEQFGTVVSPYEIPGYGGRVVVGCPCIGWFAGEQKFRALDDARSMPMPEKSDRVSMVTSLKRRLPGRVERIALMETLKEGLGDGFVCFGREFRPIGDKLDAIAPFKYHVAIENSRLPFYWTEKLADAWIGWALPIYCGDPTILSQVPDPRGVEIIDASDPRGALERIRALVAEDTFESRVDAIAKCRAWAIETSNPFEQTCRIIESAPCDVKNAPRLTTPELISIPAKGTTAALCSAVRALFGSRAAGAVLQRYCRYKGRYWDEIP